ncbi:MAG: hypothetical protein KAH57_08565 [Thermoplasmata archaeon]|nr:hypothetical protein [Thermoplasmata archaeon]
MFKRLMIFAIVSFFLFGTFSMISASEEGSDEQIHFNSEQGQKFIDIDNKPSNEIMFEIDDQYSGGQQTTGITINDVRVDPLINKRIFPNTPTDYNVVTSGNPPDEVTLIIDNDRPDIYLKFEMTTLSFILSKDAFGSITLLEEDSRAFYNSSINKWEVHFCLKISWNFSTPGSMDYKVVVDNGGEVIDTWFVEDGYIFETGLVFDGVPQIKTVEPREITGDGYIRGGAQAILSGVSLHFNQASQMAPSPEDLRIAIVDDTGREWEYRPQSRKDLVFISFSFSIPLQDGGIKLMMKLFDTPDNSIVTGGMTKELIIDSTPPVLDDLKISITETGAFLNWEVTESGSGLDVGSFCYTLKDIQGNVIISKERTDTLKYVDGRISIELLEIAKGDFQIILYVKDNVMNDKDDVTFMFKTLILPLHDLSVDPMISHYPNNIVQDRPVSFTASISNLGTEDEMDVVVDIIKGGSQFDRLYITELSAGSNLDISWTWVATEPEEEFWVVVDPYGKVDDEDLGNNNAYLQVCAQLIDISVIGLDEIVSDPQYDIVSFNVDIKVIGDIKEISIRAILIEDGQSIRLYTVPELDDEGLATLEIDWVKNIEVSLITILIDPYNEIVESDEGNNRLVIENPFLIDEEETEQVYQEEVSNEEHDIIPRDHDKEIIEEYSRGVTVLGPEIKDSPYNSFSAEIPAENGPPDSNELSIDPIAIPIGVITSGIIVFLALMFSFTREPVKYRLFTLMIPLYSKLKKDNIEQGVRFEILGYLKAKPGANYTELKRILDLNDGSLVHHLKILEREEKIYSKKLGKYKLFYVSTYRRKASIGSFLTPFHERLIELIDLEPGIIPKKLAKVLDRSQPDISYHLSELTRNGFLEKRRKGRHTHYYIRDEYKDMIAA